MRISSCIFFFLVLNNSSAQQISQYSQWAFHQFNSNPAHAGIKSCVDIHTGYRLQWVGFSGAPRSGFMTVSIPVNSRRKQYLTARHGLGAKFENDQAGDFSFNRMNLAYAAHFNFDEYKRLSFGLYGGAVQFAFDPANVTTSEPDATVIRQANFVRPDFTIGSWYNTKNYYFGLSLHNLVRSKWDAPGTDSRHRLHLKLNGGYQLLINERLSLLPVFMARIPPRGPLSVDLNLHLDYANTFGFGIGYRNTDALMFFANFRIKDQFMIAYSFDYNLSAIQKVANNTHEISLKFSSCKGRNNTATGCPLFE